MLEMSGRDIKASFVMPKRSRGTARGAQQKPQKKFANGHHCPTPSDLQKTPESLFFDGRNMKENRKERMKERKEGEREKKGKRERRNKGGRVGRKRGRKEGQKE